MHWRNTSSMLYERFRGPEKCQLAVCLVFPCSKALGWEQGGWKYRLIGPTQQSWLGPNRSRKTPLVWCSPPPELPLIKCGCHLKRASFPMNSESVTWNIDWSVLPTAWLGPEWSCPCDPIFRAHRHLHSLANSISKWQNGGGQRYGCVCAGIIWEKGGKNEWFCIMASLSNQYMLKAASITT